MTGHHPVNLVKSRYLLWFFTGRSVSYRPAFLAFYRLFCKIANPWDINLKFFRVYFWRQYGQSCKLACLEVAFPKIGIFRVLVCNLQAEPVMSKKFFDFVSPYKYQHLVKKFMVIPFVVPDISGGWKPPDAIILSENADAINSYSFKRSIAIIWSWQKYF